MGGWATLGVYVAGQATSGASFLDPQLVFFLPHTPARQQRLPLVLFLPHPSPMHSCNFLLAPAPCVQRELLPPVPYRPHEHSIPLSPQPKLPPRFEPLSCSFILQKVELESGTVAHRYLLPLNLVTATSVTKNSHFRLTQSFSRF